jgi:hypothetical protein
MTAQPFPPLLESDLSRVMVSVFPQNAEMAGACWDTYPTAGTVWSDPLIPANVNATMDLPSQDRDEAQPPLHTVEVPENTGPEQIQALPTGMPWCDTDEAALRLLLD